MNGNYDFGPNFKLYHRNPYGHGEDSSVPEPKSAFQERYLDLCRDAGVCPTNSFGLARGIYLGLLAEVNRNKVSRFSRPASESQAAETSEAVGTRKTPQPDSTVAT